jgi:hypothetical protein
LELSVTTSAASISIGTRGGESPHAAHSTRSAGNEPSVYSTTTSAHITEGLATTYEVVAEKDMA